MGHGSVVRHLGVLAVAVGLIAAVAAPGASAQVPTLESCSYTPSEVTLGPGDSVDVLFALDPPGSEAILLVSLDGEVIVEDFSPGPPESPIVLVITYDDLVAVLSEDLDRPVTEGVFVQSLNIVVGEGDDEQLEEVCALTITLAIPPEPTTTSTTLPAPEPVAPRYTG